MIFDTHAHYDDSAFDGDREEILRALAGQGVGRVIDVGASVPSLGRIMDLVERYDFLYGALGLHPDEIGPHGHHSGELYALPSVSRQTESAPGGGVSEYPDGEKLTGTIRGLDVQILSWLRQAVRHPKIVAVGEIGLDYHWNVETHEDQIRAFRAQAEIAIEAGLPILVHSRSAAEDTLRVIEELYGHGSPGRKVAKAEAMKKLPREAYEEVPGKEWVWKKQLPEGPGAKLERKGIIHAYAYSPEQAKIYTGLGFMLGIGGVLTYQNSRKLKKVVSGIPLEYLVLETDCPYLAPEGHRGERNSSAYLPEVVQAVAEIKGISTEDVERATWENACRMFALSDTRHS